MASRRKPARPAIPEPRPASPARIGTQERAPELVADESVIDFIDGTRRKRTAEEYVRQNLARSLVQEYRYPREDIAVELPIKVGVARKRLDLAVFIEGERPVQENVLIAIECKREGISPADKNEGIDQLKSYMAACLNCRFGLWTNGSDQRICFRKDEVRGSIVFTELVDIPTKGNEGKDTDVPERLQLRAATGDNLLFAFKRCHNYIAGNQGLQKPEAFWELLKIIFCKIEDERALESLTFYVTTRELKSPDGQLRCKKRVGKLFSQVHAKYPSIFKKGEEIELNLPVLAYVVGQLQGFSLLDSEVDVKGVAYEEVVGSNLRGDRGEFFTPRNACRMAVELLDPEPGQKILDPACGTGGFLVIAMNHVLKKIDSQARRQWRVAERPTETELVKLYRARDDEMRRNVVGFDINPNLVRAAKMNMVMNNDGSGSLAQADSLRERVSWSDETKALGMLGTFDLVFTNPPFGTRIRIDNPETLAQYELAAAWEIDKETRQWRKRTDPKGRVVMQSSQPPEILFIERCLQFLKPGTGRLAIVVPNGILNNPPLGYVRQWMLDNAQVLAVVDMQRDLFQPRNDTQTSLVFLRRFASDERARKQDYPIFMTVADRIGHDKRGQAIYRRDEEGNDILEKRVTRVKSVKGKKVVENAIAELQPMVDDHLPEVAALYRNWLRETS